MDKLVILGAGGHGRVVAEIASLTQKYSDIVFLDDKAPVDTFPYVYLGKCEEFKKYVKDSDFFVAIGNSVIRHLLQTVLEESDATITTLIHPSAVISPVVEIGYGTVIMAGVIVNTGAKIGKGVILNTLSSVDHDCIVDDYCHVAVGSHLCGTVHLGAETLIAAGATVINNITICPNCIVGAGATVINNLEKAGTYTGTPARLRKSTNVCNNMNSCLEDTDFCDS